MAEYKKFRVTVKMKQPWSDVDSWYEKPTRDNVMERFSEELERLENMEDLFEVTVEEVMRIGAISFEAEIFMKQNRCPAVVFVGDSNIPRCDSFGSAGPAVELKRPCTFNEMQKCPTHKFTCSSEQLRKELEKFLFSHDNLPEGERKE